MLGRKEKKIQGVNGAAAVDAADVLFLPSPPRRRRPDAAAAATAIQLQQQFPFGTKNEEPLLEMSLERRRRVI